MQIEVNFETWQECFADLPDLRVEGRTLHRLPDILFMTLCGVICGVICGMDDEEVIEEWGETNRLAAPVRALGKRHSFARHDRARVGSA